jgi:Protein of unknown function (DUF551)
MKWQPIATAPKDTGILVTDGKNITVCKLDGPDAGPLYMQGYGFSGYEWDFYMDTTDLTHWMPLPKPPVQP